MKRLLQNKQQQILPSCISQFDIRSMIMFDFTFSILQFRTGIFVMNTALYLQKSPFMDSTQRRTGWDTSAFGV